MVQFKFVSYIHKNRAVLSHINVRFEAGEFVYLLGPSSSGKTTLLKLIAGIIKPTGGQLIVMGKNIGNLSQDKLSSLRKKMGLIMDEFGFVKGSCEKNLELFLSHIPKEERRIRIDYVLNLIELTRKRKDDISLLSGSEKRQLSLARAIITDPSIILADEPLSYCDKKRQDLILDLLKKMQESGVLVILASSRDIPISGRRLVLLNEGSLSEA